MKDITAILVNYSDQSVLYKALNSLNQIGSRLEKVIVFQESNISFSRINVYDWSNRIQYITVADNDLGGTLRKTIPTINSSYVLFLQSTDYLLSDTIIQPPGPEKVLGTFQANPNANIYFPLLVPISFLKEQSLLSNDQLPFKEALLPAWVSTVDTTFKLFKKGLTKQTRKSNSTTMKEKQKIMEKYQLEKDYTESVSLSVIISNYNMAAYIEKAVVSCLLQNEQLDQLLIIDDGSTDNSYQRLMRYKDEERIMVLTKENGGKARALNELLPHVKSDFILELDADDWIDPDAVSVIKKQLLDLPDDVSVLYGNFRKWKQVDADVLFKGVFKGTTINSKADLLAYRFPLGPRVYRTSILRKAGGFPVVAFEDGRLYEDVSVLNRLFKNSRFWYSDFTVYNVREHKDSITKNNLAKWKDFLRTLK